MSVSPGSRLGPYQVLGPLGAGGIGEVHRARDTRLGRDVPVKVLPESVRESADALARFEREAQGLEGRLVESRSAGGPAPENPRFTNLLRHVNL